MLACLSIFKAVLLSEAQIFSCTEIIQHQRCRADAFFRFYGVPRIGIGFNFKFLNSVVGLILDDGIKLQVISGAD